MDEAVFWKLIDEARTAVQGDKYALVDYLVKKLAELPVEAIFEYDDILDNLLIKAHKRDLWAAAIIINGWCSEDNFADFRGWLIAQGREVYEKALADPETLVELADEMPCIVWGDYRHYLPHMEEMLYIAYHAYEEKTGQNLYDLPGHVNYYSPPDGVELDFRYETLRQKFPRLIARFSNDNDNKPDADS